MNSTVRQLEWRLRRLELALKFRVEKYRIYPKAHYFRNFPTHRGRKFWLVSWVDDKRIKVLVSGTRNPHYYAASYFTL